MSPVSIEHDAFPPGIERLVGELSARPEVLGVALFGSMARGDARPDSDLDVYVLVDEGSWRDIETRDGKHYEFVYSSAEASKAFWNANPNDCVQLWTDARILLDPQGKLSEFRDEALRLRDEGPPRLDARAVRHRRFDAEDQLRAIQALQQSDAATSALVLDRLVEGLSEVYFALNGQWVPLPKERLKRIREAAPDLGRAFDSFYTARDPGAKLAAGHQLVSRLFEASNRAQQLPETGREV